MTLVTDAEESNRRDPAVCPYLRTGKFPVSKVYIAGAAPEATEHTSSYVAEARFTMRAAARATVKNS